MRGLFLAGLLILLTGCAVLPKTDKVQPEKTVAVSSRKEQKPSDAGTDKTAGATPEKTEKPVQVPWRRVRIVIDAGHGGTDCGACGRFVQESNLNLQMARRLKFYLTLCGFETVMIRRYDIPVPLRNRVRRARMCGGDVFVSLHCNSAANRHAEGFEIFYAPGNFSRHSEESRRLAERIEKRVVCELRSVRRGVKTARFVVLSADCPAVLLEAGFISCAKDELLLASENFQRRYAVAIALALAEHYHGRH